MRDGFQMRLYVENFPQLGIELSHVGGWSKRRSRGLDSRRDYQHFRAASPVANQERKHDCCTDRALSVLFWDHAEEFFYLPFARFFVVSAEDTGREVKHPLWGRFPESGATWGVHYVELAHDLQTALRLFRVDRRGYEGSPGHDVGFPINVARIPLNRHFQYPKDLKYSIGCFAALRRLHSARSSCMFQSSCGPPSAIGIKWSIW
ncbi:hypothetical protein D3C76_724380 [compost metagenome]